MIDDNDRNVVLGETEQGKKIVAFILPNTGLYGLMFSSGGTLAKELDGAFTSITEAQKIVDAYLGARKQAHKDKKGKNAESTNN